ncbi:MAG: hypothetical protein ACHQEB_04500 [Chitinophagales bacterium]
MRKHILLLLLLLPVSFLSAFAQTAKVDSVAFFNDDRTIEMTLSTDFKKLIAEKLKMGEQPATISLRFPDSSSFSGDIVINARGLTRKETCNMPPLMLDFKNSSPGLKPLHKLKLVCGCGTTADDERLALKEYMTYKIYNQLTDMSLRVRLVHITYDDTKGKMRTYSQYGFLIEDVDAMARRNQCKEVQKIAFNTEGTQRQHMTLVALFQYMIGNSDWSVPNYHNIKLIRVKDTPDAPPYVIPYDFDYCGLVNAYYAVPPAQLDIQNVTERAYRGFPRSMEELQESIQVFLQKKETITNVVMNFEPLNSKTRKEMVDYLEGFYKIINNKNQVESVFIKGARKD